MKDIFKTSKQGGFTAIALMLATVILIIASVSYTQNYGGIKERASMNVYQAADERLQQVQQATGLVGDTGGSNVAGPEAQDINLGIDFDTTTSTAVVATSSTSDASKMVVKLYYIGEDASGGEAAANGRTLVCDNKFILIPFDSAIPQMKETIKASMTALTDPSKNPSSMEFGPFNFVTADKLSFKSASISGGVASVKLSHDSNYLAQNSEMTRLNNFNLAIGLSLTKELRDCVIKEQVKATAKQFGTAKSVNVYIDDKLVK